MEHAALRFEDILITHALATRPLRPTHGKSEDAALVRIARAMAKDDQAILDELCSLGMELCSAGSCGITLLNLTDPDTDLQWVAVQGEVAELTGKSAPSVDSPCKYSIEQKAPQLLSQPERYFAWMQFDPSIAEALIVPLFWHGQQGIGTIWVLSHDPAIQFDREHVRIMSVLGSHATAALRVRAAWNS
ncbi:GAF domain-containing protein [Noviherbaspirillum humi]|uniref:GAF domain-containing protein n=1 Tax=Noviherbaspirillum humi TaxID=1688639 RepID=A0A239M3W5_9BURK|nr:GAF domain-containing protein [Noviherbaspirillum humi]SNT37527.1 GAF domain-containing protein [Noviherbaspirillum humi]